MNPATDDRLPLLTVCERCGYPNIPARLTCKACRTRLAPLHPPLIPDDAPSRLAFSALLPAAPLRVWLLIAVTLLLPITAAAMYADRLVGLIVLLSPILWFLRRRPDKREAFALVLSDQAIAYASPEVDLRTDWSNVMAVVDRQMILLRRPAALRLRPLEREAPPDRAHLRARTIRLDVFAPEDVAAIVQAVRRYSPQVRRATKWVRWLPSGPADEARIRRVARRHRRPRRRRR